MPELHTETGGLNAIALLRYIERIEEAEAEKRAASDILNGIYAEAKEDGLQPKLLRQVIRERRMDAAVRADHYRIVDDYRTGLGLYADTPLGEAAMRREAEVVEMSRPRPFAEQPVHDPQRRRRGRPPKTPRATAEEMLGA